MRAARCLPVLGAALALGIVAGDGRAAAPRMVGIGDSIGAGVQSADANLVTQSNSYLMRIALKAGAVLPLPWVIGSAVSSVFDTAFRNRLFPWLPGRNLSVSGADLSDLLNRRADALFRAAIDSETDLMLFPRRLSQIEIAELVPADLVICWIGPNDVMGAVLSFDQLDASQTTPVAEFEQLYSELADRLAALAGRVVVANIPDVTTIPFLVDDAALAAITGRNDLSLAPGSRTTLVLAAALLLGFDVEALLDDPDWVLDAGELDILNERVAAFNEIIAEQADRVGLPVVDANSLYASIVAQPPTIGGVTLTAAFLGGLFSLDGVHPSDTGHAIIANAFIEGLNAAYDLGIPLYSANQLAAIAAADPFVDHDGDGVVKGRFGFGLLETLGPLLGLSGDVNDNNPAVSVAFDDSAVRAELARRREVAGTELVDQLRLGEERAARGTLFTLFDRMLGRRR